MSVQTENIAYSGDEMAACGKCGKANPPNRAGCLYCGAALEAAHTKQSGLKLNLRKLENWENGFNVVLTGCREGAKGEEAARYLKLDRETFEPMLAARHPFPLMRIESPAEAELAVKELSELGFSASVISDVDLKMGKPCVRLRCVEFADGGVVLTSFNTNETKVVPGNEIVLIVVGRIIESRAESVEKGKKDKRKVLAESATSSDDVLIDIYTADSEQGWRITTRGFDFSTLGAEKSMLAVENIHLVLEKLKDLAPAAKITEEYPELMSALSEVWDVERRTDFEGIKRTGVWRSGFAQVTKTSNLEQFSKYSRLQRLLV